MATLPTVWADALTGVVLAGGVLAPAPTALLPPAPMALLFLAVSLAHVAGAVLGDAFDAKADAAEHPGRPIPSGAIGRERMFLIGFALLLASLLALEGVGWLADRGLWPAGAGVALAVALLFHGTFHKKNPLSPLVVGFCRGLIYVVAAACVSPQPPTELWIGAGLVASHTVAIAAFAGRKGQPGLVALWPALFLAVAPVCGFLVLAFTPVAQPYLLALVSADIVALGLVIRGGRHDSARAAMTLVAAIALLDAMLLAGMGKTTLATIAGLGFPLTLFLGLFLRRD